MNALSFVTARFAEQFGFMTLQTKAMASCAYAFGQEFSDSLSLAMATKYMDLVLSASDHLVISKSCKTGFIYPCSAMKPPVLGIHSMDSDQGQVHDNLRIIEPAHGAIYSKSDADTFHPVIGADWSVQYLAAVVFGGAQPDVCLDAAIFGFAEVLDTGHTTTFQGIPGRYCHGDVINGSFQVVWPLVRERGFGRLQRAFRTAHAERVMLELKLLDSSSNLLGHSASSFTVLFSRSSWAFAESAPEEPVNEMVFDNGTHKVIRSLSRSIRFDATPVARGTRLNTRLDESGDDRCLYMLHTGPSALHAQFMTGSAGKRRGRHLHSVDICWNAAVTVFVIAVSCRSPASALTPVQGVVAWWDVNLECASSPAAPQPVCTGTEHGVWVARNASKTGHVWIDRHGDQFGPGAAGRMQLPLIARTGAPGPDSRQQLVYGHWLAWELHEDEGLRHAEGVRSLTPLAYADTSDSFVWKAQGCRFLALAAAADAALRSPMLLGVGLAGTSRMRGVFTAVLGAMRVHASRLAMQPTPAAPDARRRRAWEARVPRAHGEPLAVHYTDLTGSVFAEFHRRLAAVAAHPERELRCRALAVEAAAWFGLHGYCARGAPTDAPPQRRTELLVISLGLTESVSGPQPAVAAVERCLRQVLEPLAARCRGTTTRLALMTEPAAPTFAPLLQFQWQARVELGNRALRRLAAELALPVVDAHAMTLARSDATQDGLHYWYAPRVGRSTPSRTAGARGGGGERVRGGIRAIELGGLGA